MKNFNDTIRNRTRELPTCSAVHQQTALPRAPYILYIYIYIYIYIYTMYIILYTTYVYVILGDWFVFRNFQIPFQDHNSFIALKVSSLTVFWYCLIS